MGDRQAIAEALLGQGRIFASRGEHRVAADYFKNALSVSESLKDKLQISTSLHGLGFDQFTLGDHAHALENLERSLNLAEELHDQYLVARRLLSISGGVYVTLGDPPRALERLERSLKLGEQLKNKEIMQGALQNIGNVYQLGRICRRGRWRVTAWAVCLSTKRIGS